jgi:hypothetical protein
MAMKSHKRTWRLNQFEHAVGALALALVSLEDDLQWTYLVGHPRHGVKMLQVFGLVHQAFIFQ